MKSVTVDAVPSKVKLKGLDRLLRGMIQRKPVRHNSENHPDDKGETKG